MSLNEFLFKSFRLCLFHPFSWSRLPSFTVFSLPPESGNDYPVLGILHFWVKSTPRCYDYWQAKQEDARLNSISAEASKTTINWDKEERKRGKEECNQVLGRWLNSWGFLSVTKCAFSSWSALHWFFDEGSGIVFATSNFAVTTIISNTGLKTNNQIPFNEVRKLFLHFLPTFQPFMNEFITSKLVAGFPLHFCPCFCCLHALISFFEPTTIVLSINSRLV